MVVTVQLWPLGSVSGEDFGIIGQNPSVCKFNLLHSVIFRVFLNI